MQFLPNPASTACINRRFEECSEQELETEMKMFLHELKNALWHNSNTAAVPGSPFEAAGQQQNANDNLQANRYQPLGMEGIMDEEDSENEEDSDEEDSNEEEEEDIVWTRALMV